MKRIRGIVGPEGQQEFKQALAWGLPGVQSFLAALPPPAAEAVLTVLAEAVALRDGYTFAHCQRVAERAVALGRALDLPDPQLETVRLGGLLHDLGKIGVPDAVLLKPGSLTTEERRVMARHPVLGHQLLQPLPAFQEVALVLRWHHEAPDGSGYPDGLRGAAIPLPVQVVALVDAFDALTTARPYREALSSERALRFLWQEARRGRWDLELLGLFQEHLARREM